MVGAFFTLQEFDFARLWVLHEFADPSFFQNRSFYTFASVTSHLCMSVVAKKKTIGKSSLEQSRELLCDRVTDLGSTGAATNVLGADVVVDDDLDGLVDLLGQLGLLQRVLEHHADGEHCGDGVDDALA